MCHAVHRAGPELCADVAYREEEQSSREVSCQNRPNRRPKGRAVRVGRYVDSRLYFGYRNSRAEPYQSALKGGSSLLCILHRLLPTLELPKSGSMGRDFSVPSQPAPAGSPELMHPLYHIPPGDVV